jgi:hypothetical protein
VAGFVGTVARKQMVVYLDACERQGREPGGTVLRKDVFIADLGFSDVIIRTMATVPQPQAVRSIELAGDVGPPRRRGISVAASSRSNARWGSSSCPVCDQLPGGWWMKSSLTTSFPVESSQRMT